MHTIQQGNGCYVTIISNYSSRQRAQFLPAQNTHRAATIDFWQARSPQWQPHHWLSTAALYFSKSRLDSGLASLTSCGGSDLTPYAWLERHPRQGFVKFCSFFEMIIKLAGPMRGKMSFLYLIFFFFWYFIFFLIFFWFQSLKDFGISAYSQVLWRFLGVIFWVTIGEFLGNFWGTIGTIFLTIGWILLIPSKLF